MVPVLCWGMLAAHVSEGCFPWQQKGIWGLPNWAEIDLKAYSRALAFYPGGLNLLDQTKGLDLEGIYPSFVKEKGKEDGSCALTSGFLPMSSLES